MTAWVLGVVAGWCVLRLCAADRRWPWRVADLSGPSPYRPQRRRRPASPPRTPGRRTASSTRRGPKRTPSDLVEVIDLLHVAVSAGLSPHEAVRAVGRSDGGPVARSLVGARRAVERGHSLADALGELPDTAGPDVRPLVTTLVAALRSGDGCGPPLQRLADAQRRRQRRASETRVRRLPVLLLAPLVGLVLPAFVILTIVPVALTTAHAGLLPASA